uniref:Retrovirus-related Pol polyprotein from transposon 17.6 n=1 Tax=Cajanus cajan TaxID=3821 RepID=A0A151RBZ0_CAJCA|nr:Retrovirus-related Pol polyprotein from transposon 17.6 [Cajanus cajan]
MSILTENANLFAWNSTNMPGIDPNFICHRLAIYREAKFVSQKQRKIGDEEHTAFIIEQANYCYHVMPFGLKNAGATYQRLMDKVFANQIGRNLEVYVDDMVIKTKSVEHHVQDLAKNSGQIRKHNMRLNPEKCVFGVQGGKFLGFMITCRGIEPNLDKCQALINMRSPKNHKEVQSSVHGARVIRAGYYWPTMRSDCKSYVQRCKACQEFGNLHRLPPTSLQSMQSAWPFAWWGMDILGPFPIAKDQLKFLLVGIDYFTKWIEAEALAKITAANVQKFTWKKIICVLWAYHCTPQTTTQETPYKLTYGSDAMIPVEVGEPSHRRLTFDTTQNTKALKTNLDLVDEIRKCARVQEEACKVRAARRYNSKLKPRSFREGDLVWRAIGEARKKISA